MNNAKGNKHSLRASREMRLPLRYKILRNADKPFERHVTGLSATINGGALYDL